MHKTYVFRTPSNQKIEVDSKIYSFFRDIITVEDLKFLFTSKERLYSMDLFELAFFNKATKQKEILNHDLKLSDLHIDEYQVIHVEVPKKTDNLVEEVDTIIETCVKTIVENAVDAVIDPKDETPTEKAVVSIVEKAVEKVADNVIEAVVDPVVEKAEKAEKAVETIEKVVDTVEQKIVEPLVENPSPVSTPVAVKVDEEEKDVKKKFCIIC